MKKSLSKLYYSGVQYKSSDKDMSSFEDYDNMFNAENGIFDIYTSKIYLEEKLSKILDDIKNDVDVEIKF